MAGGFERGRADARPVQAKSYFFFGGAFLATFFGVLQAMGRVSFPVILQ